ncbi:MAG: molybdopterin molybdotransferase MoeA [Polyangiaceae bacterium]|nr:molybdopterin molybdotransferase MoeA [Polyangiaceae bacterium]
MLGESRAGGTWPAPLAPGSAMRIFTGAPLPEGADSVIAQEDTRPDGERVAFFFAPRPGHHVRARGSDVLAGKPLLPRGHGVRAASVALLASQGIAEVRVYRRPIVSVLCSGDELRAISDPPRPGSIINSNLYALLAAIEEAGAIPRALPTAPDDLASLRGHVADALRGADLVITTGAVSVGAHDHMRAAFDHAGIEQRLWKVRIKPGKPLAFGLAGDVPVVGLPGNPVSALVTFELFVRPGLRRMLGDPRPFPRLFDVRIEHAHRHGPGRDELARGRLDSSGSSVTLFRDQGSAAVAGSALADVLVLLPADRETFEAGERVRALGLVDRSSTETCPFG